MDKIGTIIRNHRIAKNMTQEELGKRVFVSKQAVSKWETGKTVPDIEMIRKLCVILEINKDEILGGSIEETKKNLKWLKVCVVISAISLLVALFFGFGGSDYIDRHTRSGVAYVSVFSDGELLSAYEYRVESDLRFENFENGYKFDVDYGEVRGMLRLFDEYDIEFGFVNTNNWHNIQIRLDVERSDGQVLVVQTVSYETDDDLYEVVVTDAATTGNVLSVFREGV